jgi:hypothetical protein
VWFKFHTPNHAQNFSVSVSASYTYLDKPFTKSASFPVSVTEPVENTPPDPRAEGADGKAVKKPAGFIPSAVAPTGVESVTKSWKVWKVNGAGNFSETTYGASLASKKMSLTANGYVQTAADAGRAMKSGYGFDTKVETQVGGSTGGTYNVTPFQNGRFLFPEFNFATYDRLAAFIGSTSLASSTSLKTQHFSANKYSPHQQEAHFTPLWYPDGAYKVYCQIRDAWTPMGELRTTLNARIDISGDLYDDWHVAPQ